MSTEPRLLPAVVGLCLLALPGHAGATGGAPAPDAGDGPPALSARDREIRDELRGPALERLQEALADREWLARSAHDPEASAPDPALSTLALQILARSPVFRPGPDARGRVPTELAALRVLARLDPGQLALRDSLEEATPAGRLYLLALMRRTAAEAGLEAVGLDPETSVPTVEAGGRLIRLTGATDLFAGSLASDALWQAATTAFPAAPATAPTEP